MNHKKVIIISAVVTLAVIALLSVAAYFLPDSTFLGALAPIRQKASFTQGFYAGTLRQLSVDNTGKLTIPTSSYLASTWDYLGSTKLAATASSTATVTIPARDIIEICASITSYAGNSDIASFVFNGDTSTIYTSRYISVADGTTTVVNTATTSAPLFRMFAVAQSAGRVGCAQIANSTSKDKFIAMTALSGTGTATSTPIIESGGGEYATTTQIISVKMTTAGATALASGSGFVIYGKNF